MTKNQHQSFYPWLVWCIAAGFFFGAYYVRIAPSVMSLEMMRDFNTNALLFGLMNSLFFLPYILMQIPVGLLVDKFGAKRLMALMALVTSLGCVLLAMSSHLMFAYLSRILIGFAASFAFVGAIRLSAMWHPPARLALVVGMTQGSGMLGAAVGDAPVALLVDWIGWRPTLMIMGLSLMMLSILIHFVIQEKAVERSEDGLRSILQKLWLVLKNPQSWFNACYAGLMFAPMAAFAESWGILYLMQVHDLTKAQAAFANSLIFIGWAFGGPLFGRFSDAIQMRKPLMYISGVLSLLWFTLVLNIPDLNYTTLLLLLFLFGLSNPGVAIAYTVSNEINPPHVAGTSLAFCNMSSVIIGGAFLQNYIGWVLNGYEKITMENSLPVYPAEAFHHAMQILPVALLCALAVAYFIRETKGKLA